MASKYNKTQYNYNQNSLELKIKNEKGQTLVEFLFLLSILIGIALFMMKSFHNGLGERWKAMVTLIARPTNSPMELR